MTLCASNKWELKTTDIKSADLQGHKLDRDVYLTPPKESGLPEGKLWKLRRCLYGLNDAVHQFYSSVVDELTTTGCKQSRLDSALFYLERQGVLIGVVGSHIDDFLHAGTMEFDEEVMDRLCSRFLAGRVKANSFKYVEFEVKQNPDFLLLD